MDLCLHLRFLGANVGVAFDFEEPNEIENGFEGKDAMGEGSAEGILTVETVFTRYKSICSHRSAIALAALGMRYGATN